ncbi:MAG: hypothetical protein Q9211_006884 [Gyalolechia sp. 1 TL-2023]
MLQALSPSYLTPPLQSHSGSADDTDVTASQPAPAHPEHLTHDPSAFSTPQTPHAPMPPSQSADPVHEGTLSELRHLRQLHDLRAATTEAKIRKIKAVASPRVRSARSAGVSAASPDWQRPRSVGQSIHAVRPKGSRGKMLQRAVSEREIPRLREGVVLPSPRLGPGIKWGDGWTRARNAAAERHVGQEQEEVNNAEGEGGDEDEPQALPETEISWTSGETRAWHVGTGSVVGLKQPGMVDDAEEESDIKDESRYGEGDGDNSRKDGNDSSGGEGKELISDEQFGGEGDEVVAEEKGGPETARICETGAGSGQTSSG